MLWPKNIDDVVVYASRLPEVKIYLWQDIPKGFTTIDIKI